MTTSIIDASLNVVAPLYVLFSLLFFTPGNVSSLSAVLFLCAVSWCSLTSLLVDARVLLAAVQRCST
jgi:hypothetical protein